MDASSAAAMLKEAEMFRKARESNWQGTQARGGPLYETESTRVSAANKPQLAATPLTPQSHSLWHVLEAAVGGGQQGKLVSRLLQKHLLARIDALPIDAIELMAGEAPPAS